MPNTRVRERIMKLFSEKLHVEVSAADEDLFESGALDSLRFVELLLQLEQEFGIKIPLDELDPDRFRSVAKIAEFMGNDVSLGPVVNGMRPVLAGGES